MGRSLKLHSQRKSGVSVRPSSSGYSATAGAASKLKDIVSYREKRDGGCVRCSRCGNENPDGNRFCGMCGAALLSAPSIAASAPQRPVTPPTTVPSAPAPAPSRPQTAEAPRSAPTPQPPPSISGPSFLGLNDRSPQRRTRGSLSIDPHSSSSNVDYLLDDDDEPRHFGAGKVLLILIALGLAVGFGYLRWKNQGLSWLNLGSHKPAAAVQNSESNDENAPASPSITPESQPSSATPSSAPSSGAAPPSNTAQPSGATQPAASSAPNGNPPAAAVTTPAAAPAVAPPAATAPANNTAPVGDAANAKAPANTAAKSSDESSAGSNQPSAAAPPASSDNPPAAAPPKPAPKPHAARAPAPAVDPVAEAQKYLYGRGAGQDCDRGLRILKPAANAGNAKAMIEMGALYSAGLCTPHDLPTAYRWFALALRKDPSNDAVQTDLQKLWSEMTQPERQLAIKLSQ